jgi:hypothetical protein
MAAAAGIAGLAGSAAAGEAPMIGRIQGAGSAVDGTSGTTTATLVEGSMVTAGRGASRIELAGGTVLALSAGGEARIFASRAELRRGALRIDAAPGDYGILAADLEVAAGAGSAVGLAPASAGRDAQAVSVAAGRGEARVATRRGQLLARIAPGAERSFEPAPDGRMQFAGCLERREGHLWLVDETANLRVEIAPQRDLVREAGNRVQVRGGPSHEAPAGTAAYRIEALEWTRLSRGCGTVPGRAAAAGASAGKAAGGTLIAVVAGVAVAATLGGLVAAGSFGDGGSAAPPLSR